MNANNALIAPSGRFRGHELDLAIRAYDPEVDFIAYMRLVSRHELRRVRRMHPFDRDEYRQETFWILMQGRMGRCENCGAWPEEGKRLQMDHCHLTGIVRALLCGQCNKGEYLGSVQTTWNMQDGVRIYVDMYGHIPEIREPDFGYSDARWRKRERAMKKVAQIGWGFR